MKLALGPHKIYFYSCAIKEIPRNFRKDQTWKKANVLKRNWQITRNKTCPVCGHKVTKKITGELKRWRHFCVRCQVKG